MAVPALVPALIHSGVSSERSLFMTLDFIKWYQVLSVISSLWTTCSAIPQPPYLIHSRVPFFSISPFLYDHCLRQPSFKEVIQRPLLSIISSLWTPREDERSSNFYVGLLYHQFFVANSLSSGTFSFPQQGLFPMPSFYDPWLN